MTRPGCRPARRVEVEEVASGVAVLASDDDRHRDMVERYGDVAHSTGTCGVHVHVDVASADEGVAVVDRVAPWLPVLLAVSANLRYAGGVEHLTRLLGLDGAARQRAVHDVRGRLTCRRRPRRPDPELLHTTRDER